MHRREGLQSHRHLRVGGGDQEDRQHADVGQQVDGEGARRRRGLGRVDRHGGAQDATAEPAGQRDAALQHDQRSFARSRNKVAMHGLVRQFVLRQHEGRIPQRARGEHGVAGPDLPVEARQRLLESRVRQLLRQSQAAVGRPVEPGDNLVKEDAEFGIYAPLDVALSAFGLTLLFERQRGEHGKRCGEQQAQTQGAARHGSPAAMR